MPTANQYWILLIFFLLIVFIIIWLRQGNLVDTSGAKIHEIQKENLDLQSQLNNLKRSYKDCQAIKFADENIFSYIRCINVPRKPVCKAENTGGEICRSRQIDCNKFKLYVLDDPVAILRMKLITDDIDQVDKTIPPNEIS